MCQCALQNTLPHNVKFLLYLYVYIDVVLCALCTVSDHCFSSLCVFLHRLSFVRDEILHVIVDSVEQVCNKDSIITLRVNTSPTMFTQSLAFGLF